MVKQSYKAELYQGDLYDLLSFYRRALLSTRILCQREKLSGKCLFALQDVSAVVEKCDGFFTIYIIFLHEKFRRINKTRRQKAN